MPTGQADLNKSSLQLFFQTVLDCGKLTFKTEHHRSDDGDWVKLTSDGDKNAMCEFVFMPEGNYIE